MTGLLTIIGLGTTAIYVVYLLLRNKQEPLSYPAASHPALQEFKSNAKQHKVHFDNCQFKDSSYLSEVEQTNHDYTVAALMVGSTIGFYHTPVVRKENIQSVLLFNDKSVTGRKRLFQTFYMDITTLKYHVMMGNVTLFIDGSDPEKYYFDLAQNNLL